MPDTAHITLCKTPPLSGNSSSTHFNARPGTHERPSMPIWATHLLRASKACCMSQTVHRGCKARVLPVDEGLDVVHVELLAVGIREEGILVASRTPGRILHTFALLRIAVCELQLCKHERLCPGSEGAAGLQWLRSTPLRVRMAEQDFHCRKHEQIHPSHLLIYYARSCSSQS